MIGECSWVNGYVKLGSITHKGGVREAAENAARAATAVCRAGTPRAPPPA